MPDPRQATIRNVISTRDRASVLVSLFGLLLAACALGATPRRSPGPEPSGPPFQILTSVTVLADLIRQVGAERVEVTALVPSGADPNTFQPAARQVLVVSHADAVFFNGLGLDRTARGVIQNANRPDLRVVTLSEGLPTLVGSGALQLPDERTPINVPAQARGNPYLWLDPRMASLYVERIRDHLAALDPAGADVYQANAARYVDRIRDLDQELESQIAAIPPRNRKLVTLHDGFPYLAARYGLEHVGVVIKTPGREPTAQEVADISRAMRHQEVQTVFTEPQLNARLLKLAARDAGINIGTLYSDTLDQYVPTYEALLRYNARQLVSGLK